MFYTDEQIAKEREKWKNKFMSECKKCDHKGYFVKDKMYNTISTCDCVKLARSYANLICSGIPQGYLLGGYKWDLKRKFDKQCKIYADSFEQYYMRSGKSLYIYGGAGSGKTTMAVLIAKELSNKFNKIKKETYESFFISYEEILDIYAKKLYQNEYEKKYTYLMKEVDLLIIDGVGYERNIKDELNIKTMEPILQKREQNKLPFVLLSNLDPIKFNEVYGKDCYDIVNKNCEIILINGTNFRKNTAAIN